MDRTTEKGLKPVTNDSVKPQGHIQTNDYPRYLTISDLSRYIHKAKATIYCQIKSIPHIKNGNQLLFDKNDIDEWLATKKCWPVDYDALKLRALKSLTGTALRR